MPDAADRMDFKISVLVFIRDAGGRLLLIERRKEPNRGSWSPIGGKLEMSLGESPFECAVRETREETGLEISASDLHLFGMVSEKAYEGSSHWLMFLFDCGKRLEKLPPEMDEGRFRLFSRSEINSLKIPETDRKFIWKFWDENRSGFAAVRADCTPGGEPFPTVEQFMPPPAAPAKNAIHMENSEKILDIFRETKALMEGHFILRSGLHSGHFFQCARVCEHLDRVGELVAMLVEKLNPDDFDAVLAPAMGGLVLGQEMARQMKKRFIFAEKVDGRLALRRNFKISKGERFLIVEDVITRGGRVDECINIIRENGGTPKAVAVLVDRSAGQAKFEIPHTSLLEFSFPTYSPDSLPPELAAIPAEHPGS